VESVVVRDGRGVSIRLVLLLGLVVAALAYPGLRVWTGRGHELPPASWGAVIVLVFMACGVFFAGLPIRRFLRGQAKKPLNPLRAMRTLVLAQAAALTGALVAGWYLAQVLVLWPDLDIGSVRAVAVRLAALAAGGVLMAIAGLVAQAMCRVDKVEKADKGNKGNSGNRDDGRDRDDWGEEGDREDDESDNRNRNH
jgi:Protein of unknown function (DUF3180).